MSELKEKLLSSRKNGFDRMDEAQVKDCFAYAEGYKTFMDEGKIEREAVTYAVSLAEGKGFRPFKRGDAVRPGDKLYVNSRGKTLFLAVIGQEKLSEGAHIAVAHIDAPHIHLKPNPLYEESEMGYFKTHYYGGIRKYQWVTIPLELRGVVVLRDGTVKKVNIGKDKNDPLFVMTDLLPHLAQTQNEKTLAKGIEGEQLNLLIGSRPLANTEGGDRVKLSLMKIFNEKYGITEDDFVSAELGIVPAYNACDIGLDRSMVGAYGHDDKVCAYAALTSILQAEAPQKTAVSVLVDKEEVGSNGVTSMRSAAFDTFMEDLCEAQGVKLRACFERSFCLSADVCAAFDPTFPDVYEKRNAPLINYGPGVAKYLGVHGKSGCSDASAEVIGYLRRTFDAKNIVWQMAELGKVDGGGGGTIAAFIANRNIDTVDIGVPVLSMHAPFEIISKVDLYMLHQAFAAVFASAE